MTQRPTDRQRIATAMELYFPNNQMAPPHMTALLGEYHESGVGPSNLVNEIETREDEKVWPFIWEAMLYRHLRRHDYSPTGGRQRKRPDFRIEHDGRVIWIEAVCPMPKGIPLEYLKLLPGVVKTKPDIERVLRCSTVIATKREKMAWYRDEGVIGADDCAVVALNICKLSEHAFDDSGYSRYPLAMECLFGLGPLAAPIGADGKIGPLQNTQRISIKNPNGVEITTTAFLEPLFENVSAVIQGHQDFVPDGDDLLITAIHNPLALTRLPRGLLGPRKEFVARPAPDATFDLSDLVLVARIKSLEESVLRRFHAREDRAVRKLTATEAGDFRGEYNQCFKNVCNWVFVRDHYTHLKVPGWLITSDGVLDKHWVVDIGEGELVDVTPFRDTASRTFLRHDGTEDEFFLMKTQFVESRAARSRLHE